MEPAPTIDRFGLGISDELVEQWQDARRDVGSTWPLVVAEAPKFGQDAHAWSIFCHAAISGKAQWIRGLQYCRIWLPIPSGLMD